MFFPEIFSYVPDIRLNWTVRNVEPSRAMCLLRFLQVVPVGKRNWQQTQRIHGAGIFTYIDP